ncbi:MAG: orotate phosphoribosyltransferase [Gammaproteobacteria bacterium]|nr:orotate phosphoribosyltransferase [Gammaproteobacteria bacterium]
MLDFQKKFIEFAIKKGVLCFGEFTLKSGRSSPYFFNSGLFNDGLSLQQLGSYYRQAIVQSGIDFDMLFGPAYKGIPLAAAVSISFATEQDRNLPYCFDRKEEKDHGEGGKTMGAPLAGNVLLIDDVITAGTSVRYSRQIIENAGAKAVGISIGLDRQERGQGERSAIEEIEADYNMQVISIINLENLIEYLSSQATLAEHLDNIVAYRKQYGVNSSL